MPSLRIVIGSLGIGGAERHLEQILPQLNKIGWNVRIVTLTNENALEHTFTKNNIQVIFIPEIKLLTRLPKIIRQPLKAVQAILFLISEYYKHHCDITNFFLPESYILGMIASFTCNRNISGRLIMSRRSRNDYQSKLFIYKYLEKYLHTKVDHILANSQNILKQLNCEEKVLKHKSDLIYNGIDLNQYETNANKLALRSKLKLDNDTLLLIVIANLIPYKGHSDLFYALEILKKSFNSNWKVLLIGEDRGIQSELVSLSSKLHISEHIIFLGRIFDVRPWVQASNIGILCSHQEGFSNAILEYMAASLPVIATDVGGNSEAVLNGKTGYVVPSQNPRKLADAIISIAGDPKKLVDFGHAGRNRVEQFFSLERCVSNYDRIYRKVLCAE